MGPKPRSACPDAVQRRSLDVLHLLPDALHEGPRFQDACDQLTVVGLGCDRVDLTVELLRQEIELPADGPTLRKEVPDLRQVRAEPGELFRDIAPCGPSGDLLGEPPSIRRR